MRYIIHVSDGYDYIGPFSSKEDARACGKRLEALEPKARWSVVELTQPNELEASYRQ